MPFVDSQPITVPAGIRGESAARVERSPPQRVPSRARSPLEWVPPARGPPASLSPQRGVRSSPTVRARSGSSPASAQLADRTADIHVAAARTMTAQLRELEQHMAERQRRALLRAAGWVDRIEKMLAWYDPECAHAAEALLLGDRFRGCPWALLAELVQIYGPEPPGAQRAAPQQPAAPPQEAHPRPPIARSAAAFPEPRVVRVLAVRVRPAQPAGMHLREVSSLDGEGRRVVVASVDALGPAAAGGLRAGDEVQAVAGCGVQTLADAERARAGFYDAARRSHAAHEEAELLLRVSTVDDNELMRQQALRRLADAEAAVQAAQQRAAAAPGTGERLSLAAEGTRPGRSWPLHVRESASPSAAVDSGGASEKSADKPGKAAKAGGEKEEKDAKEKGKKEGKGKKEKKGKS
eukprot:TRINITY_DN24697_c0_g1_i2.p1 TRINITY_DN24697_c0_g1~~TRINITY_DN24697_c0_g1_i2.p1  ORF type:complete len:430 (+),score=94.54 TRINITY_DN24697_c0_g1_i2:64-1290(+)